MKQSTDRGLLAGYDIPALIQKTQTEPYSKLWDYLVERTLGVAARCREEGKPFDQGGLAWHDVTPMIVEAALIHRLSGNQEAMTHIVSCIDYLLEVYGKLPTTEDFAKIPRSRAAGGVATRPKVLSHGEIAMAGDIVRESLPEKTRETIIRLMKTSCIPYHNFKDGLAGYSSGGNVILCQNINAAICALTWGEESDFDGWETVVDNTCDAIRQYLRNGCDEKGFSYEGMGYGLGVMDFIFLFCHILRAVNWHDDLLKTEPRLRIIPEAYQHILLPDRRSATDGDSGCGLINKWWLLTLADEYNRPDYRAEWELFANPPHPQAPWGDKWPHIAKVTESDPRTINGAEKKLIMNFLLWRADAPVQPLEYSPMPTAVCSEGAGTATFRTSWKRDAVYASMLGAGRSRACFGHAHSDCGHINIAIGDEYLAIDPGRYNWPEDQHSVILIDGQNSTPLPAGLGMGCDPSYGHIGKFQRHRMLDYCVADAAHMKSSAWALRHFFFIRTFGDDGYIVLLDNINTDYGKATHEYWWQLQCATTARIDITGKTTGTVYGNQARIDCSFFQKPEPATPDIPHTIELRQDIKEWVWPYGKDQDPRIVQGFERRGESTTSVKRPRLLAIQTTLSCMLMSILSPRRLEQENRSIRQIPVTNGIGLEITGDGITDTVLSAPDHKLIMTDDLKCFSEFAVIRRDTTGTLLDIWTESGEPVQFR